MAAGVTEIKNSARLVFDLTRDGEKTTRSFDIAYPIVDEESEALQSAIDAANTLYTSNNGQMNKFVQPANWRDAQITEEQWMTTGVYYEIVVTTTTPINPTAASLGSAQQEQGEQQ